MDVKNLAKAFYEMFDFITDLPSGLDGFDSDFDEAYKELENIQSNDVQEVRHGKWRKIQNYALCTCCKHKVNWGSNDYLSLYCPNCGAKMDEERVKMTPQEAIAFLVETKLGCKYSKDNQLSDICDISIKALEKQIPEQLDYEGDGYADDGELIYDTAICRNCERKFEFYYNEHFNYCPDCGQKLDWSD